MVIVASSGNDSDNSVIYPAALPTTISIGATDNGDNRWGYSNYGPRLDLAAPAGFETTSRGINGDLYDGFGGTSQAAPVVSGIAGLILSESRDEGHNLSNNDVVHLLERTAEDVNSTQYPGRDNRIGHGRVNAYEALAALQPPNEVTHGPASFTKIYNDDSVSFPNGFVKENGVSYGAGTYICDIYKLSATASSPDFYYKNTPLFWLPVTEPGFSAANPNDGSRSLSKSVSKSSAQATTYFYYVESNINGQEIGWVPFDPTVHKRGGSFEYTVIGEPDTPPLTASISGPSNLSTGESGTWSAGYSGGTGAVSYSWEKKSPGSSTWSSTSCSGASCTLSFVNSASYHRSGSVKVAVTRGSETAAKTASVSVEGVCAGPAPCMLSKTTLGAPNVHVEGKQVRLVWDAAKRLDTKVAIEHRTGVTDTWSVLDEMSANRLAESEKDGGFRYAFETEDLALGEHEFRLRLPSGVDGGAPLYSKAVSAQILLDDAYELNAYPNPVQQSATIQLAVQKQQDMSIRVYDVLGRQVTTLHNGPMRAQQTERLTLNPARIQMASGTYFIRVTGEEFVATERLTVVR